MITTLKLFGRLNCPLELACFIELNEEEQLLLSKLNMKLDINKEKILLLTNNKGRILLNDQEINDIKTKQTSEILSEYSELISHRIASYYAEEKAVYIDIIGSFKKPLLNMQIKDIKPKQETSVIIKEESIKENINITSILEDIKQDSIKRPGRPKRID